jgi:hypothetical protein
MRAKFIYEKFEAESDPIADMNIGGLNAGEEFDKLRKELLEKWSVYLRQFLGKKIKGMLHYNNPEYPVAEYTTEKITDIRINYTLKYQFVHFKDENGNNYIIIVQRKKQNFL